MTRAVIILLSLIALTWATPLPQQEYKDIVNKLVSQYQTGHVCPMKTSIVGTAHGYDKDRKPVVGVRFNATDMTASGPKYIKLTEFNEAGERGPPNNHYLNFYVDFGPINVDSTVKYTQIFPETQNEKQTKGAINAPEYNWNYNIEVEIDYTQRKVVSSSAYIVGIPRPFKTECSGLPIEPACKSMDKLIFHSMWMIVRDVKECIDAGFTGMKF